MEFLNPAALYGLFALPLLLIPYLIRKQPQRVVFSSLLLFADLRATASSRPWGRLRLPPIFFLQLLLLALLILALGEPVFSVRPSNIAIVLDNSASMQTLEDGKSRFVLAREKARGLLGDLAVTANVDLYQTVPRLERIRAAQLNPTEALAVLASLEPYDLGDVPIDYSNVLNQMAREHAYERVYLVTDHRARGQAGTLRVITVGQPGPNLAITSFQVSPASLVNSRLRATAEVTNFSSKDERMKIFLKGSGTVLASRELAVPAGKTASASYEGFAVQAYYEAEIDARDGLALDNRRFAVPPKSRNLRILGISPRPQALTSLRSIPGIDLDIIMPEGYEKTDRSKYELEIFQFAFPAVLPKNPALFVLPPENNSLADLEKAVSRPVVSSWREPHTLTRYVNFSLFRPSYARPLRARTAGEPIIDSPNGPLVLSVERNRVRYLVLGFDPLPYLGRQNLPISIFTLNFLDWFFENAGGKGNATGEPLELGAVQPGGWVVTPKAEKISLSPGSRAFPETFVQGIYQLNRGGERELFAVNFEDTNESDLRNSPTVEIRGENGTHDSASTLFSFWPYLLLASLLLMIIEWFIRPRASQLTDQGISNQILSRL
jgi:hypothetical protein